MSFLKGGALALTLGASTLAFGLVGAAPARADDDELKREILREMDERLERFGQRLERRILEGVGELMEQRDRRLHEELQRHLGGGRGGPGGRGGEFGRPGAPGAPGTPGFRARPGGERDARPDARPDRPRGGFRGQLERLEEELGGTDAWREALGAYRRAFEDSGDWMKALRAFEHSLQERDRWSGPSLSQQFERIRGALEGTDTWERALEAYRRAADGRDWKAGIEAFENALRDGLRARREGGEGRGRPDRPRREGGEDRERPDRPRRDAEPERERERGERDGGEREGGAAFLGVSVGSLDELDEQYQDEVEHGVLIVEAIEGSAAAKAGLKQGDVILSIGKDEVKTFEDLAELISKRRAGDKVRVRIFRDGWVKDVDLRLGARPTEDEG